MPRFRARAVDERGRACVVTEEAESEEALAGLLAGRGMALTRVVSVKGADGAGDARLTRPQLAEFTDRLQILYAAGVPLVDCVREIEVGSRDPRVVAVAAGIRRALERGANLSETLDSFPKAFPAPYRAAVRAGEESGALDEVLRRLVEQIEWEQWIRRTIKQAFVYPTILFLAVIGLVVFLFTFLLPRLMEIFVQANVELPGPTRVVIAVSDFLRERGVLLLIGAVLAVAGLVAWRHTRRGRRTLDRVWVRLPAFGQLASKVASARFVNALRTLHEAGTPILSALEMARDAAGNAWVEDDLDRAIVKVREGLPLTAALEEASSLEPLVPRMISVGEKSGSLGQALEHVQKLYDREVEAGTKRLLSLLEPAILLFSGGVVAFVVFATLLPIFRLFGAMKR